MRKLFLVLLILVIGGAALQLIRPKIGNPPVTTDLGAPPEVEQVLRKDCYDCHSNETRLTWFDQITPANFLVAADIKKGRQVLNFSHWDSLTKDQRLGKLYEALNQATFSVMPPSNYTRFHTSAKISPQDLEVLRNYLVSITPVIGAEIASASLAAGASASLAAGASGGQATGASATRSGGVQPAPNGIAFPSDYKNWEAISTTERFDNGTMRVIFGNDVAVKAIKEQHTNPWPDGTVFAKAAWDQVVDSTGKIHPGAFKQIEFMIKDKEKYAGTDGWGFGRWIKGTDLVPYGRNALFATECTNCHKPMQHNDFVFTEPIQPQEGKVITSGIDRRTKTMFTLYGNDTAAAAAKSGGGVAWAGGGIAKTGGGVAKTGGGHTYPACSELSLVTWVQRADPHWFGANIPDQSKIRSVEKVMFKADARGQVQPVYETTGMAPGSAGDRISYILAQRASVIP